jgi:hypothetical protein
MKRRSDPDWDAGETFIKTGHSAMTTKIIALMLIIVAVIHLVPLVGVLGNERLAVLYGLDFAEPNLSILMRHRAVLFGLLGVFFLYAAFNPGVQPIAFVAGFVSVLSFLWLVWSNDGSNSLLGKIASADVIALVCLIVGTGLFMAKEYAG